jgi:hypothetical protein
MVRAAFPNMPGWYRAYNTGLTHTTPFLNWIDLRFHRIDADLSPAALIDDRS